ncbi:F-box/LRR-repeat protein At3g58900 [Prunus persica]|nr:F-box/LRR-repeat protein At3g58900 [Prunus persica]
MDGFSNLPDQVAHYILSFLTITDLARFGCASKRCRELYLSAPSLNFDGFSVANQSTCMKRQRLFNCLDRFFFCRGDNKIQSFRVRWFSHVAEDRVMYLSNTDEDTDYSKDSDITTCFCEEHFRVMSWVHNAVRCNVEELDLDISPGSEIAPKFPSHVFLCASLTSLSVDVGCTSLTVPSFTFSSNLKYLELTNGLVKDGFFKWISSCCKCIEDLVLQEVAANNITIESSSLKTFSFVNDDSFDVLNISCEKLESLIMEWIIQSPSKYSLNIFAPRLKYFSWKGNLMNHRNLGNLEILQEAEILMKPKGDEFENVFEVLCSLSRAKVLTLNEETIKALFRGGSMPPPLNNVCSLGLRIGNVVDELVPAMVSLFRGMPNLCNMLINTKPPLDDPKSNASGFNIGYWKMQNIAFINQLKDVTIKLSDGSNGVELVRFMLERAQNLEKMLIICLPQNLGDNMRRLEESKKFSRATVLFKESRDFLP